MAETGFGWEFPQPGKIVSQGSLDGWTTFVICEHNAPVLEWCRTALGRQHRGIYLPGFDLWLGNGGRWRWDARRWYDVGLMPDYVRIWLHRPEDIALFRLRWS